MKIPRGSRYAMVGLLVAGLAGSVGVPQKSGQPPTTTQNPGQPPPDPFGQNDNKLNLPPFGNSEEKQAKMREEDRQKRLVADTDKLLALATQLHEDVAKTDRHILSIDVVKRAEEIEKLAHSVKEREKG